MKKKFRKELFLAIFLFFVVNLLFNFQSWKELTIKKNPYNVSSGDSTLAEFILENNYQQLINGKNPFIIEKKLFHPFPSINVSMNDPGFSNVIFFFIFRPFLGVHESMLLVVLINIFLANLLMYLLLRSFGISFLISLIVGFSFGFSPVIAYRVLGHYTYTSVYVFPLIFLLAKFFTDSKTVGRKFILSLICGITLAFLLLLNFYYFIGFIFLGLFFILYHLISTRKKTFLFFIENFKFLITSGIVFVLSLAPWLYSVYMLVKSGGTEKTKGFAGAVELSGDLFGLIMPSEFNPFYKNIITFLADKNDIFFKIEKFYLSNTEKFNYASLLVIFSLIIWFIYRKKITAKEFMLIKPYLYAVIFFGIITLGPFLKVWNHWVLDLDGVAVVFPLPFLLIRYLPGLSSLRAPTRFSPIFIFLALIVSAYVLNSVVKMLKTEKRRYLLIILFAIFLFDQFSILPKETPAYFPLNIYKNIKNTKGKGAVLEIPFNVRDGFQYIGYVHAIGPMNGQLIHGKPIIGGYFARIHSKVFEYYKSLKFIGYITKIIDKGNFDPLKEKPKEVNVYPFPFPAKIAEEELNSLNIRYVILKNDEKYTFNISQVLEKSGFLQKQTDGQYDLYIKD